MTQIADELRKVREDLASIAYRPLGDDTATCFCGVSMQNTARKALTNLDSLIPEVEDMEHAQALTSAFLEGGIMVLDKALMEGATTRKDEACSDAAVTPSATDHFPDVRNMDWLDESDTVEAVARAICLSAICSDAEYDEGDLKLWSNFRKAEAKAAIATIKRLAAERAPQSNRNSPRSSEEASEVHGDGLDENNAQEGK